MKLNTDRFIAIRGNIDLIVEPTLAICKTTRDKHNGHRYFLLLATANFTIAMLKNGNRQSARNISGVLMQ